MHNLMSYKTIRTVASRNAVYSNMVRGVPDEVKEVGDRKPYSGTGSDAYRGPKLSIRKEK